MDRTGRIRKEILFFLLYCFSHKISGALFSLSLNFTFCLMFQKDSRGCIINDCTLQGCNDSMNENAGCIKLF